MKKDFLLLGKKTVFFAICFLGIGLSVAFGVEALHYGDTVYIQNFKTKLYATQDGNIFVGRKDPSDKASFMVVADIENPDLKKGEIIKYGNSMYFRSSITKTPTFIGNSGKQNAIYGMKRQLLGLVTSVEKNKIYKFTILPSAGKIENQTVYYGEKINLQYYLSSSKSPIKYFRFTPGGKVFGSDDSKLMTITQIKETKELIFEKAEEAKQIGKGGKVPPKPTGKPPVPPMPAVTEQNECTICLEAFQGNVKVVVLPCGHIFHAKCPDGTGDIIKAIEEDGSYVCPLCRQPAKPYKIKLYKDLTPEDVKFKTDKKQ